MKNEKIKQFNRKVSKLIKSNKFLLAFSFLVAFSLWLWVSIEKSPIVERVIVSVPVHIDFDDSLPEKMGLKMFGNTTFTVDVTVSGKKFIVSNLTANDIEVVAQTNNVDSAGNKSLSLKSSVNGDKEFNIKNMSQYYVSVYFDTLKETEFQITPNVISVTQNPVSDDCYLGEPILSTTSLTVSGPSAEVSKITGVRANYTINSTLTSTSTVIPEIEYIGTALNQLSNSTIDLPDTVNMVIPVLKDLTLPVTVGFKNSPSDYNSGNIRYSVYPKTVTVGVPVEQANDMKEYRINSIDFSELNSGNNTFTVTAEDTNVFMIKGDVKSFKVNVNFDELITRTVSVPASAVTISKQNSLFDSTVISTGNFSVRVVGPADVVNEIAAESIRGEIDLTDVDLSEGINVVNIRFFLTENSNNCWVYGDYTANINSIPS